MKVYVVLVAVCENQIVDRVYADISDAERRAKEIVPEYSTPCGVQRDKSSDAFMYEGEAVYGVHVEERDLL